MTDDETSDQNSTGDSTASSEDGGSILERGGVDTDARAGRSMGIDLEGPPPGMTEEEVEAERKRRLDPANRPEGAEVDNTGRNFDPELGEFTDPDPAEQPPG